MCRGGAGRDLLRRVGGVSSFAGASSRRSGRFERNLQHAVAERVAVERLNGHQRLVVVGHRDEAESLALVRLQVADHLDALDGAERPKQLPQDALFRVRRQVVDEYAPAGSFDFFFFF